MPTFPGNHSTTKYTDCLSFIFALAAPVWVTEMASGGLIGKSSFRLSEVYYLVPSHKLFCQG
jgi:hypothetical protein